MCEIEEPKKAEVARSDGQLAHVTKTLTLPEIPNSVEELAEKLQALGHNVVIRDFEYAGERSSGWLARMSLDGTECIAKFSGPPTDDMFFVYSNR